MQTSPDPFPISPKYMYTVMCIAIASSEFFGIEVSLIFETVSSKLLAETMKDWQVDTSDYWTFIIGLPAKQPPYYY